MKPSDFISLNFVQMDRILIFLFVLRPLDAVDDFRKTTEKPFFHNFCFTMFLWCYNKLYKIKMTLEMTRMGKRTNKKMI